MIRHQDPGQAAPAAFGELPRQTRDEVAAVDVVAKDRAAFDPTQEYVVTGPLCHPGERPEPRLRPEPGGGQEATSVVRAPRLPRGLRVLHPSVS